jgi:hypothetical protein
VTFVSGGSPTTIGQYVGKYGQTAFSSGMETI